MYRARLLVLAFVLVMLAGCLRSETTHTLTIADGGLSWVVVQRDLRSVEDTAAAREAEERAFVAEARAGRHPVAVAFEALGALDTQTTVVRDRPPALVLIEGRFASIEAVAQATLAMAGLAGRTETTREADVTTWRIEVDLQRDPEPTASADLLDALLEEASHYTVLLADGRFVHAEGFALGEDGRSATLAEMDLDARRAAGRPLVLSLSWR